jgi:hypothetical protein
LASIAFWKGTNLDIEIAFIKLFGKIQNTESVMPNRQIGNISTTSVVADPAFVMHKGFTNWDYNFETKINENFPNDEIYLLARAYNRNWLPLKNKIFKAKQAKEEQKSVIKMDDIF